MKTSVRYLLVLVIVTLALQGCSIFEPYVDEQETFDVTKDKVGVVEGVNPVKKKQYYGFSCLDLYEKQIYNRIDYNIRNMKGFVSKFEYRLGEVQRILELYFMDNPDLFFVSEERKATIYYRKDMSEVIKVPENYGTANLIMFKKGYYSVDSTTRDTMKNELDTAVKQALSGLDAKASDYSKVKYIHDYLMKNVQYDKTEKGPNIHNAYGALVSKKAVCDGYSNAFQLLCYEVGIECLKINGKALGVGHSWNKVRLGKNYYNIDVTWDDVQYKGKEYVSYVYFCLSDEDFNITHKVLKNDLTRGVHPISKDDKKSYHQVNGQFYESFDDGVKDRIKKSLVKGMKEKEPYYQVRFKNVKDYNSALTYMTYGDFWQVLFNAGIDPSKVFYQNVDELRIIMFTLS